MAKKVMLILTLMLSGRAMTLVFLGRVGAGGPGDPPAAWLMPLVGDAIIGLSALLVVWLMLTQRGLWVWLIILIWNALAIWDALSAFLIHTSNPWPEFFMVQIFGAAMFFVAALMHLLLIGLALRADVRRHFLGDGAVLAGA